MRKYQKKKTQNFINTLYEAHDEIKKSIETNAVTQARGLLAQCQETAIKMGTLIEETEGEDFTTIELLEQYCELLFQIHEELNQMQNVSVGKAHKTLRRQLIRIENSVKNDVPVRLETVFLPYKASMWDSLESVWQAAEEDDNCDAYVIPIPYYDRNPDRSLGDMHYEGEQFPEYVPITHYEEYNLEEHHPDMIYIHNPYDGQNLVTSVHPAFYASKLSKCTDELVYIPYFVAIDDHVPEHFCILPGVLYANKVIVQSVQVRQAYIEAIRKYEIENHCKGTFGNLETKIQASGSPKFEKIKNVHKEDFELPKEWMELLFDSDGKRKKLIFYNTTIGAMLKDPQKTIKKIRKTLYFFENQKTIVLLWRPHPLLEATLKSMHPKLVREYNLLEEQYRAAHYGIFDDSADLYRAIMWSDAYYGDMSSVVEIYKQTGKPIMIQNIAVI